MKKHLLPLLSAALLPVLAGGLSAEAFHQRYPFKPGGLLTIDAKAGDITITGSDSESVTIDAEGQQIPIVTTADSVVTVMVPGSRGVRQGTDLNITVNRRALVRLSNGVGDIAILSVAGGVQAGTGVGNITASNLGGAVDLETGTGDVEVQWPGNGSVGGSVSLSTGVGNIKLALPDSASAVVTASTGLGEVEGDNGQSYGRRTTMTLGAGGPGISLETGIGNVTVSSKQDKTIARRQGDRSSRHRRGRDAWSMTFGGGGGLLVMWPDRSGGRFNRELDRMGYPTVSTESPAWGGEGYAQLGRFRIGGMGWGNSLKSRMLVGDSIRRVEYGYGYGGVILEYVAFRRKRFDLSLGTMLGAGGIKLRIARGKDASVLPWQDVADLNREKELNLENHGFAGYPYLRAKYKVLAWLAIQLQAGYVYAPLNHWRCYDQRQLADAPKLDGGGWTFSVGPHFGI